MLVTEVKKKYNRVHKEIYTSKTYIKKEKEVLCQTCFGMAWRRAKPYCRECRSKFAEEHVKQNFELRGSSADLFKDEE